MLAKNEEDIIGYTIEDALKWTDFVVMMDNNSSDNTAAIMRELCSKHDNVFYWGKYEGPFHDWLRSLIFNDYKHLVSPGDWVCRLDADEFYIDNPKDILTNLPHHNDMVYSASFQYYYTEKDLLTEKKNSSIPAHQRLKYYLCNHSEQRFCKIKEDTFWPLSNPWPIGLKSIADKRIRLKHFQYRTEEQMKKRFDVRQVINLSNANKNLFLHELSNNKVFDSSQLLMDNGVYTYEDKKGLPGLPSKKLSKRKIINAIIATLFKFKKVRNAIYPPSNTRTR